MKKVVRFLIFIFLFCLLFYLIFKILWVKRQPTSYFFDAPKYTYDVVYIGPSNVLTSFNPSIAFKEYGITVGNLSNNAQVVDATKYLIMESQKFQKPKVYIIDIGQIVTDYSEYSEGDYRQTIDSMPFSINRIKVIDAVLKHEKKYDDFNVRMGYYFSFFKYHNRWKEILHGDVHETDDYINGFYLTKESTSIFPFEICEWRDTVKKLPEENEKVLLDLIDYIKSSKLNVIFVIPPRPFLNGKMEKLNYVSNILKENDLNLINFNKLNDYKIDCTTDLYNETHINTDAATKFTIYFSEYLVNKYNLSDHRGESKFNSWYDEYDRFINKYEKFTGRKFQNITYDEIFN